MIIQRKLGLSAWGKDKADSLNSLNTARPRTHTHAPLTRRESATEQENNPRRKRKKETEGEVRERKKEMERIFGLTQNDQLATSAAQAKAVGFRATNENHSHTLRARQRHVKRAKTEAIKREQ